LAVASRRANTVAGVSHRSAPWSLVTTTGTPRRAASVSSARSAERSNHCRVSARSATSSRATSASTLDSARPWMSWSTKLNTNACTPSPAIAPGSRRDSSSASAAVFTFT
jgi:hypothetical protein